MAASYEVCSFSPDKEPDEAVMEFDNLAEKMRSPDPSVSFRFPQQTFFLCFLRHKIFDFSKT